MNNKILFTDLDGTLLNSQKKISDKTYEKIMEMTKQGHKFVLASGRSLENIKHVRTALGLTQEGVYITAYHGAVVYDCGREALIAENRLDLEVAQAIYAAAQKAGLYGQAYTDTHILAPAHTKELDFYRRYISQPYYETTDLHSHLTKGPHKLLIIHLENKRLLDDFRSQMMHTSFADSIESVFSNPYYLEFYSKKAGKGNGLRILCNALHIPIANAYACGDEENDISMLQAAGTGIAMKNASPIAKEAADIVTDADNDHDAIAEVIDRFILSDNVPSD